MRIHINKKGKASCSGLSLWEGWEEIYDEKERRGLYSKLVGADLWSPGWDAETFCSSCLWTAFITLSALN